MSEDVITLSQIKELFQGLQDSTDPPPDQHQLRLIINRCIVVSVAYYDINSIRETNQGISVTDSTFTQNPQLPFPEKQFAAGSSNSLDSLQWEYRSLIGFFFFKTQRAGNHSSKKLD